MEEKEDPNLGIEQNAEVHGSTLKDSLIGQAGEYLNQVQGSANFQGDNGRYINNIITAFVVPPLEGVLNFMSESFKSFQSITSQQEDSNEFIDLKQRELQLSIDQLYWPFHIGREDTYKTLSEHKNKLIVLPSPPNVTIEEPIFRSIRKEGMYSLNEAIKKYYSPRKTNKLVSNIFKDSPVVCLDIFKDFIEDAHANCFSKLLGGMPTLIINSCITHKNIFINITVSGPQFGHEESNSDDSSKPIQLSLPPLKWQPIKKELCLYMSEEDACHEVFDIIIYMQTLVAIFASDLYCMSVNWNHEPCLSYDVEQSTFPEYLSEWVKPFTSTLSDLKTHLQDLLDEQKQESQEEYTSHQYDANMPYGYTSKISSSSSVDDEGYNFWFAGVVALVFGVMIFGSSQTTGKNSQERISLELSSLEELERAISVWDDTTALKNIRILKGSRDQCISEYATMLERSLRGRGAEGFTNVYAIKTQLNSQLNCSF